MREIACTSRVGCTLGFRCGGFPGDALGRYVWKAAKKVGLVEGEADPSAL